MDTPVSKSAQPSPEELDFPPGMFFEAGDYTEVNTRPEDLAETRRRVSRHRSKLKAAVTLQLEDLGRITSSLHAADRQGNSAPHWDSAVALVGKLQTSISHLASQLDKAERRYEATFEAPPPADSAALAASSCVPTLAGVAVGVAAAQSMVFTAKPSGITFPSVMAAAAMIQRNAATS